MKQDTVILFYPKIDFRPYYPCFWAPLSILAVASTLFEYGIRVILLDGNLQREKRDLRIIKENLDRCLCLGISVMVGGRQLMRALDLAKFVKTYKPHLPIVFGGPLATVITEILWESPTVDLVVRGQGEKPMLDIVLSLMAGIKINEIPGVLIKENPGSTKSIILDKNQFPPYPWHLVEVERYVRQDNYLGKRVLNYVSSQGCPQKCGYCSEVSSSHLQWRAFSAERVLNEIQKLAFTSNLDGIKFYDANFFVNSKRVLEFAFKLLSSKQKLKWGASAHPCDVIRLEEDLAVIKRSGLNRLLIGAESGSKDALARINKGCTVDDVLHTAEICAQHQIPVAFTFIVGIPGIDDDLPATKKIITKLKNINTDFDIKIHFFAPLPGAPLFAEAKMLGYHPPQTLYEWAQYDYYLPQTPWVSQEYEKEVREFERHIKSTIAKNRGVSL